MPMPNRTYSLSSGSKYRFGFNTQEKDDEVYGEGNLNTALFWEYDTRIGRRWNIDPKPRVGISDYSVMDGNPILLNDILGDCPDCKNGKYKVEKGNTFSGLEKKWNMKSGSLSAMNKGLDPKKLQIGQEINVTLSKSDLPAGVELNSNASMNGMDNFFKKGTEGVNQIVNVTDASYDKFAKAVASTSEGGISENTKGGSMDAKKYFLNNKEQYSNNTNAWFKEQNSVSEPATRMLFVYKGIGYNLNEFGNLTFGSAKAINGVGIKKLITAGDIYSIFSNGRMDDPNEKKAVKRGHSYYEKE